MSDADNTFEHTQRFELGELGGNVRHGKLEAMYEELFTEVIEDGVITQDERDRLDKMADNLGLDRARLARLEKALQAAYEARHRVVVKDLSADDAPPPATLAPIEPSTDVRTLALERRIKQLEARIVDLQRALDEARAHINVEVDLSDVAPRPHGGADDDPIELARRVRRDPRDAASLHALFRHHTRANDADARWCVAEVLSYLGAATPEEQECWASHREAALIRPAHSVTQEGWHKLLFHPEEEPLVGEIFSIVVSAVLLGRLSALRRDRKLVRLDPEKKQDPTKSTIQAVRCFHWAAAILGMASPPLYADTAYAGFVEMVPGVPPASRLGERALSGRSAAELAFMAGKHLASYREEHFVELLVPSTRGLEDVFLAALSIGSPGLPMNAQVRQLVTPIAEAIEPILDPAAVDRLRQCFLRFVEEGGRTNLERWRTAVGRTGARAGLLLANDLRAAHAVLSLEDEASAAARMDDLMSFVLSDRYTQLRRQVGISVA